ncbi:gustatory receptor for sugar taste 43a-like isoform X4 [Plutella xylostella]|uniref:gustatory receptor for sugar taste 43a-like isoform X4 n=1 Tax=Plutella xylostella TaxID=51655 RepID=UPI002032E476|nr:gustatory receptor for sugar taste 43a-like isoform X4 [Plutella xylostella]
MKGIDPAKEGAAAVPRARSVEKGTCVVDGAHAFILRISSLFGLAPLRFESRPGGFSVALSAPMCVYSYILVTVLVICTVLGLVAEINVGTSVSVRMSSRMSQVVSTCDVLVVAATAGAGVYGAPARMRSMLRYMESVASLDVSLGAQYSSVSERKLCAVLLSVLFLFSVLIVDDFCFYARQASRFDRTWDVVTNYIGFYLLWFVVVILELQFAFTALSVRARFRAVNDALAHTASCVAVPLEKVKEAHHMNMFAIRVAPADSTRPTNVSLLVDSMSPQDHTVIIRNAVSGEPRLAVPPCEAVRRLGALHGSLCEVIQRVDCSYALPLVVILISTLLHLIVTPYFLIMEIIVSTNRVHFLVLQFLWCAMHMLRMFVVVEPCHYTITEGKRTEELVCRLMTHAPSTGVLPSRLELFSRQLMRSFQYSSKTPNYDNERWNRASSLYLSLMVALSLVRPASTLVTVRFQMYQGIMNVELVYRGIHPIRYYST